MTVSEYEAAEAEKIVLRRQHVADKPAGRAQEVAHRAGHAVANASQKVPGADQAVRLASAGYEQAVSGLAKALSTTARLSLSERALLRRYAQHDPSVTSIPHIRRLDLEVIDRVRPRGLAHRYAVGAGVEGAGSGLLMAGGAIIAGGGAVFGAGAGAAPGVAVAAGVFAADTATVLVAASRLTVQIGSYYGYDPRDESEQLFTAAVINLGTAGTAAAKNVAYVDLFRLTNALARGAGWPALNAAALTKILRPVFERLGKR